MSTEALRAVALSEAVKATPKGTPTDVVHAAEAFFAFLYRSANDAGVLGPMNPPTTPPPAPPAPKPKTEILPGSTPSKPPVEKKPAAPKKPVKTEDELAAEALARAEAEDAAADAVEDAAADAALTLPSKDDIADIIDRLLKGGKRADAVQLLKKYKAASVSGVKPADYPAFVAEGIALIGDSELTA